MYKEHRDTVAGGVRERSRSQRAMLGRANPTSCDWPANEFPKVKGRLEIGTQGNATVACEGIDRELLTSRYGEEALQEPRYGTKSPKGRPDPGSWRDLWVARFGSNQKTASSGEMNVGTDAGDCQT